MEPSLHPPIRWTPLIPQSFYAEKVKKSSPMGRPAQPVELAPSFVFLASDESRFVNGEILGSPAVRSSPEPREVEAAGSIPAASTRSYPPL